MLVLLNVGEGDLGGAPARSSSGIAAPYAHQHAMVDHLSAKIEMELGELDAGRCRDVHGGARASPSPASSA